ncbi:MAG: hypothetical protein ACHREM_13330 [Polyangiales bacterium]
MVRDRVDRKIGLFTGEVFMFPSLARAVRLSLTCLLAATLVLLAFPRAAGAVPAFARKYQTSCNTCHTIYPVLNPFGEAFRRNGYRFPSQEGSSDSDSARAPTIPLGQPEFKDRFPDATWPSWIAQEIPLGFMINGAVAYNMPGSDAEAAAGDQSYTHSGIISELHIFAAGAFSDKLTYFSEVNISGGGADIESAYVLFNDLLGPPHAVNLWVGRLFAPQLNSWGLHSSYLSDTVMPATTVQMLFNAGGGFGLPGGHSDGVELNGILGHVFDYSIGWLASGSGAGLSPPTAADVYAHVGLKLGGMSLDGEGAHGVNVQDPNKPWAETSVTIDAFGYHGKYMFDAGTAVPTGSGTPAFGQTDTITVVGGNLRVSLGSLLVAVGGQYEKHSQPFTGQPYQAPAADGSTGEAFGVPDNTSASAITQFNEIDYVVFPWLVPGVRTEYTTATRSGGDTVSMLRVIPGVAIGLRQNIRLILTADIEQAKGIPFASRTSPSSPADPTAAPAAGAWAPVGGALSGRTDSKTQAEQVNLVVSVAF